MPSRLLAIVSRRGVNARVAEGGERVRIPLAREDRADDPLPGPAAEIADDIRELDVHLGQHLLHPLDAGADGAHVVAALAPVRPHDANLGGRVKRVAEQTVGVQLQQPLAFLDVTLAPGQVLRVSRVDQIDVEAAGVQNFVERDPIDTGRLHGDRRHATLHAANRRGDASRP